MIKVGDYVEWNGTSYYEQDEYLNKKWFKLGEKYKVVRCDYEGNFGIFTVETDDGHCTLFSTETKVPSPKPLKKYM